ncbi:GAF domain-containing protein [Thermococcus waiotapuensis]|uniref:Uncharacterized protein n=1 Tax=Thermococcus waiotapuensis TaxID=90909 RepID=A0AAE4NTR9_9EURY|nr:hypothetical protein [Thermococcus waiotapuensis]MDV3103510.1 hypothetical protein [Thermococcus waiotapuensis]
MPFGVPGWKWKVGRFGYTMEEGKEEIKAKTKELLEKASKGNAWRNPRGVLHVPLVVEDQVVGELWEDLDPKGLEVGAYWFGKWGTKVQLVKDGRVVGFVRLA